MSRRDDSDGRRPDRGPPPDDEVPSIDVSEPTTESPGPDSDADGDDPLARKLEEIARRRGWSRQRLHALLTAVGSTTGEGFDLSAEPEVQPPATSNPRYTWIKHLASGGQGDIWRVFDHKLERILAIKVLRVGSPERARAAMLAECAITVALSHPGIVPVFDRGETVDGRPWFAMKEVEGEAMGPIVDRLHHPDLVADGIRWTLRRLVDLLSRICAAVAYAHQQEVVHGDLKPGNIMVGPFGEALVMDWGLARRLGGPAPVAGDEGDRPAGTAGYLPPERYSDPAQLSPLTDIYALGAILYRILTGRRPPRADPALLALPGGPWPPGLDPSQAKVPAELVELCRHAMEPDPARRLQTAGEFGAALVGWLDGARQREQALALVEDARAMRRRIHDERREIEELQARAAAALAGVEPSDPISRKREGWRLADSARERAESLAIEELAFEQTLRAALTRVPDLPEAHQALAEHYRSALERAEERRDRGAARRNAELLRLHDDGRHARWLAGDGALTLICEPAEARVTLMRYVTRDRQLVPVDPVELGAGPVVARPLARGSYVAVLEAPGHHPVRYPVHIERGEHWHGRPPGRDRPHPIKLPPLGTLDPEEIYVPAGWTRLGGDVEAPDPLPRRRLWVDGFVIERTAITHRRWLKCMQDLLDNGFDDIAMRLMPRRHGALGAPLYALEARRLRPGLTDDGDPIRLDAAVVLVDWFQADRFADIRATLSGLPWRLPHDLEWEKAARGVDGRHLPWGDHFDASRATVLESFAERPRPLPVACAADDESPYGVRDMVGGVRNWCSSDYEREGPGGDRVELRVPQDRFRVVRGGSWASKAAYCRPAGRFANRPDQRFRIIGARLVRSFG